MVELVKTKEFYQKNGDTSLYVKKSHGRPLTFTRHANSSNNTKNYIKNKLLKMNQLYFLF